MPAADPDAPLLVLDRVSAGYAREPEVIEDITLELRPGEIVAVTSIDMAGGKTTLLKVAAGLLEPRAGRVLFDGQNVFQMGFRADQRYRERSAVVLEGGALFVNRTIWDNVAFPLRYHQGLWGRALADEVERLLAMAGYNEDLRAFPWQVSTRSRRLAAFARALARDPELVLVDRFFEGLEMPDWRRLFELVLELNRQGVSWLLVSELDPAIFQVANRACVLEEGQLIAQGTQAELLGNPRLKAAFQAAEDAPKSESGRILIVDSGDERDPFASGTSASSSDEPVIVLDGSIPAADGSGKMIRVERTRRYRAGAGSDAGPAESSDDAPADAGA